MHQLELFNAIMKESLVRYLTGNFELFYFKIWKQKLKSVVGQPATGLLVKVLKMRHQSEMNGGHWTFVRKMWVHIQHVNQRVCIHLIYSGLEKESILSFQTLCSWTIWVTTFTKSGNRTEFPTSLHAFLLTSNVQAKRKCPNLFSCVTGAYLYDLLTHYNNSLGWPHLPGGRRTHWLLMMRWFERATMTCFTRRLQSFEPRWTGRFNRRKIKSN